MTKCRSATFTTPSPVRSAGQGSPPGTCAAICTAPLLPGRNSDSVILPAVGGVSVVTEKLNIVPQRNALALGLAAKVWPLQVTALGPAVSVQSSLVYTSPL